MGPHSGKPKCTFSATHVVAIHIRGEPRPDALRVRMPDDGGLVGRFLRWTAEQEICPMVRGGYYGGGGHMGFYAPADAERIAEWLKVQDVTEVAAEDQP